MNVSELSDSLSEHSLNQKVLQNRMNDKEILNNNKFPSKQNKINKLKVDDNNQI